VTALIVFAMAMTPCAKIALASSGGGTGDVAQVQGPLGDIGAAIDLLADTETANGVPCSKSCQQLKAVYPRASDEVAHRHQRSDPSYVSMAPQLWPSSIIRVGNKGPRGPPTWTPWVSYTHVFAVTSRFLT
jgi:hypothetical protein